MQVETMMDKLDAVIEAIKGNSNAKEIAKLEVTISTLNGKIDDLKNAIANKSQIEALNATIGKLNAELESLKTEITELKDSIDQFVNKENPNPPRLNLE